MHYGMIPAVGRDNGLSPLIIAKIQISMGILKKIRRHAAMATGNFAAIFKDVSIPPLPAALTRLIREFNQPEPNPNRLAELISSDPGIAAKVIQTVNSAMFSLRMPVSSIEHAVSLLGVREIRSLTLACAAKEALPRPKSALFDHEAFWTDSLLHAMLSRAFSRKIFDNPDDNVFTASLLTDVAIPVLLCVWSEYYELVIKEWRQSVKRLSEIEREHFGWDHAQAGAWVLQSWGFPEEMVCYILAHNLSRDKIREYELDATIAAPIAVAAVIPSVLRPDPEGSNRVFHTADQWLSISGPTLVDCLIEVGETLSEIMEAFDLSDRTANGLLDDLIRDAEFGRQEEQA